ncbi:MAG TPA: FAD-dependent oxidoreductase [Candidatus Anoxymicrobiaceae bacterium]
MKAIVMGGGMSGLAAAINLLDLGIDVELVEADEIFGGRANSWLDEDGDMIDNALHVFMPYYVNLLSFFKKMGISENIMWKDSKFYFQMPGGESAILKFIKLPAPFHAVYAMGYLLKDFKAAPRWKMILGGAGMGMGMMRAIPRMDKADKLSMESFLSKYGSLEGMRPLMEPAINGLTFTRGYEVSAKVMMNWFLKMFVSSKNSRIGFANGGLGEIWVDSCTDYIEKKGGKLTLKKGVTAINMEGNKVKNIVFEDGETAEAELYVSAMSPYSLRRALPEEAFDYDYFRQLWRYSYAPSLSLQVWFDKKITDVDVTFFSNGRVYNTYADLSNVLPHIFKGGSMMEMVLSPADYIEGLPDRVIFDMCIEGIKEDFPLSKDAEVKKWKVVRERQGVYRPYPGMEEFRPFQRSPLENFYMTGDFTKTHVSSGGMEAAIWTANKTAELIAADKMNKSLDLNVEYKPYDLMVQAMRIMEPLQYAGIAALGLWLLKKKLFGKKAKA